jgi:hypothetical protein
MIYVLVIILAGNTTGFPDRLDFYETRDLCQSMRPVAALHYHMQGQTVESATCSPRPIHPDRPSRG